MEGKAVFLSAFPFLSAFLQHWQGENLHPAILTLPKSVLWHKLMIKYFIFETEVVPAGWQAGLLLNSMSFIFSLYMCTCMFACNWMQVFVGGGAAFAYMHLYICIWKSESNLKSCSSGVIHILFFKSLILLGWLVNDSSKVTWLCFLETLGFQFVPPHQVLYVGVFWRWN